MFTKASIGFVALSIFAAMQPVVARERILERDNRAVYLHPRRFGQEQPAVLQKLRDACPGQVCGVLAGQAVTPLLAAQPECSQQDLADSIIDASKQFDAATQAKMIAIAKEYRQAEKNTPPDFSTNPPTARNSVFCQKAPKNPELNGLVQAQDPANNPNLFFDPAKGATVQKGSQANTAPFRGGAKAGNGNGNAGNNGNNGNAGNNGNKGNAGNNGNTGNNGNKGNNGNANAGNNNNAGNNAGNNNAGNNKGGIGNFGKCSVPRIEFAAGIDGRRETSFQPSDKASFTQGSAQNIDIITRAMCDQLVNTCGADQTAKDTCAKAKAAASAAPVKTGAQADAFNKVFGINTNFARVTPLDNQGRPVVG